MLDNQVAWVTGAGSGIGQSAAVELARTGAMVILSGRRIEALAETVDLIAQAGGKSLSVPLDIADAASVAAAGAAILDRHGRIDILVNSAGTNTPKRHWGDLAPEEWTRIMAVNANGAAYCAQAVIPAMRRQGGGLLIHISSWFGRYDGYIAGPAYNASKHAVAAMSASINIEECIHGIRSTVVYPGEVATPILKARPIPPSEEEIARMLRPDDVARAVRYIAEQPPHVCLNELVISPTWNRLVIGGKDLERKDLPTSG